MLENLLVAIQAICVILLAAIGVIPSLYPMRTQHSHRPTKYAKAFMALVVIALVLVVLSGIMQLNISRQNKVSADRNKSDNDSITRVLTAKIDSCNKSQEREHGYNERQSIDNANRDGYNRIVLERIQQSLLSNGLRLDSNYKIQKITNNYNVNVNLDEHQRHLTEVLKTAMKDRINQIVTQHHLDKKVRIKLSTVQDREAFVLSNEIKSFLKSEGYGTVETESIIRSPTPYKVGIYYVNDRRSGEGIEILVGFNDEK